MSLRKQVELKQTNVHFHNYTFPEGFGQHLNKYLEYRLAEQIKESSLLNEVKAHVWFWRYLVKNKIAIGNELEVQPKTIQNYSFWLHQQKLKDTTKQFKINTLSPFYQKSYNLGWLNKNPMSRIEKLPYRLPLPKVLSESKMKALLKEPDLNTVSGCRDRTVMELMWSSGIRADEVINLKLNEFSENFRSVRVIGKADKEAVLPVTKIAAGYIKFWVTKLRPHIVKEADNPYLFISLNTGDQIAKNVLKNIITLYATKIGLKKGELSPHVFRYSLATHLHNRGVDLFLISEMLRHNSIDTTSRYVAMDLAMMKKVFERCHPAALD